MDVEWVPLRALVPERPLFDRVELDNLVDSIHDKRLAIDVERGAGRRFLECDFPPSINLRVTQVPDRDERCWKLHRFDGVTAAHDGDERDLLLSLARDVWRPGE